MKKNDWVYHIKDDGSKKLLQVLEVTKTKTRELITYARYKNKETVICSISVNRCKKLTRHEVMRIAQERINEVCEEFGVWTDGDSTVDGSWAILRCRTDTSKTISI